MVYNAHLVRFRITDDHLAFANHRIPSFINNFKITIRFYHISPYGIQYKIYHKSDISCWIFCKGRSKK